MALQPPPPRPQQPGIDVNDFFQQPANTTSIGGGTGTSVAPAPAAMDLHTQSHIQPRNTPCPPVTLSSLTQQFPRSTSPGYKTEQEARMLASTYMPVPLQGTSELSPSALQAFTPQEEQQLMHRLRMQNGLQPAPASPLNNNFVMYNSPDAGFIRNQLWRMDQLYVENELRIQHIDNELREARAMLGRLFESKRAASGGKDKADQSKKKKQKVEKAPGFS